MKRLKTEVQKTNILPDGEEVGESIVLFKENWVNNNHIRSKL